METNEYLMVKTKLINLFLSQMVREILDISYEYDKKHLKLQIVLLKGYELHNIARDIENSFQNFTVDIEFVYLTKDEFNSNKGNWLPAKYEWLLHVLYSKAEIR